MIFFSCGKDSLSDTQTKLVDVTPTISETSESDNWSTDDWISDLDCLQTIWTLTINTIEVKPFD